MENKIRVLVVPVTGNAFTAMVEPSLKAYRAIVPGWDAGTTLEACYPVGRLGGNDYVVYLDENGLLESGVSYEYLAYHGINPRASELLGHNNFGMEHWGGALVGGAPGPRGEETEVPPALLEFLGTHAGWTIEEGAK